MLTASVSRPSCSRMNGDTVLGTAHIIAQLAKDVTDIAKLPFASEAASLVLSLLEIAKGVKDNNDARVRLVTTAATYLIELGPILDPQGSTTDIPPELRLRLDRFQHSLVDLKDYLEKMKKRNILKHIFGKDRISTTLLDREKALQDSYNALLMWTVANTYIIVRSTVDIPRYDQAQVVLKGTVKANSGFFSELQLGELRSNGDRQRVLVKRFLNQTKRDDEARKWRKLWHANLPQLAGCSSDRSTLQFILFHDTYHTSQHTEEIRSLAAFLLDFSRLHDVPSLADKIINFVNDAISAVRHIQAMLNYDEDEAARLARITEYTISCDGQIVVTPPLQALTKARYGVLTGILFNLFPSYGTSEASMRRYFAHLDGVPTHATPVEVLDGEHLEKWAALENIGTQIRLLPNGFEKRQQYIMPETRWACTDYSIDIEPGDFGVLDPGESEEYAFRRIGDSAANNSALFEYQSLHQFFDRDVVEFEVVCEQPKTWRIDRLTDGCLFHHGHGLNLTHAVHRSKRFLQLSAPKDCDVDELVFVVGVWHYHRYQYDLSPELIDENQVAEIFASVPYWDTDELHFSHCAPGLCSDSCEYPFDSRVRSQKYNEYMHIEYVTVPVQRHTARLEAYEDNFQDNHKTGAFRHKEFESTIQRRILNEEWFWAEWP